MIRRIGLGTLGRGVNSLLSGAGVALVLSLAAHRLGAAGFGLVAEAVVVSVLVNALGRVGVGNAVVRLIPRYRADHDLATARQTASAAVALTCLVGPVAAVIATVVLNPGSPSLALVLTLFFASDVIRLTFSDVLRSVGNETGSLAAHHGPRTVIAVGLAFPATAAGSTELTIGSFAFANLVLIGLAIFLLRDSLAVRGWVHEMPRLARLSRWHYLLESGAALVARAPVLIASVILTGAAGTEFAGAAAIASQLAVPISLASITSAELMARFWARDDVSSVQRTVSITALVGAGVGIPVCLLAIIFAPTIVDVLYGPEYAGAEDILRILLLGAIVALSTGPGGVLLEMTGFARDAVIVSAMAFGVLALGGIIAATAGAVPLAIVSAFALGLQQALEAIRARQRTGVSPFPSRAALAELVKDRHSATGPAISSEDA